MSDQVLILILIGLILLQGAFIMISHHKFVNKIMSRSFDEYKRADVMTPKAEQQRIKLPPQEEYSELGIL